MRDSKNVFHLAIPVKDLDEAFEFYVVNLGCKLARRYDDRITLDFFGDQVVCHLNPGGISKTDEFYPRHFGITFAHQDGFDRLYKLASERNIPFTKEKQQRFPGLIEEHQFFALIDPSNNILEFKHYNDPRMIY